MTSGLIPCLQDVAPDPVRCIWLVKAGHPISWSTNVIRPVRAVRFSTKVAGFSHSQGTNHPRLLKIYVHTDAVPKVRVHLRSMRLNHRRLVPLSSNLPSRCRDPSKEPKISGHGFCRASPAGPLQKIEWRLTRFSLSNRMTKESVLVGLGRATLGGNHSSSRSETISCQE